MTSGHHENEDSRHSNKKESETSSFLLAIASVAAAAFGVQSQKNRDRDFKTGKFSHFVIAGLIFVAVFILSIIIVVNLVLAK